MPNTTEHGLGTKRVTCTGIVADGHDGPLNPGTEWLLDMRNMYIQAECVLQNSWYRPLLPPCNEQSSSLH